MEKEFLTGSEIYRMPIGSVVETSTGDSWRVTNRNDEVVCVELTSTKTNTPRWYMLLDDGILIDMQHVRRPHAVKSRLTAPVFKRLAA
jgi:hypothetical protein